MTNNKTLEEFLSDETARGLEPALATVVRGLAQRCADLSGHVSRASALGISGDAGSANVQGETQKKLDVLANDLLLAFAEGCAHVAGIVSEELDEARCFEREQKAPYLLVVDPLDGSSNVDANVSVGTIFSVLPFIGAGERPRAEDFLQAGTRQLCAGYAIYGPSTVLTLTLGRGTHSFTFDWATNQFVHTADALRVPHATQEFAINMSNSRFWEPPVQRYVDECLAGTNGPRGADFNMRWIASLVAEAQRIFSRGGIFMYPRDNKEPRKPGRLRLLYEANPIALLMEQAGAAASTGTQRILDIVPDTLHQRVPLMFGSREEVERLVRYHDEPQREQFQSPLFRERTLFIR